MSDEPAAKLRATRKKAGYASAKDFADHVRVKFSTYVHHENGTRSIQLDKAMLYFNELNSTGLSLNDLVPNLPAGTSSEVLQHLRRIEKKIDRMADDLAELKARVGRKDAR